MLTVQNYFPGQKATIFLETLDPMTKLRADSPTIPVINRVIFPDLSLALDFPQNMVKLDVGLYYFQFTVPFNAQSVGSYLVDGEYTQPVTNAVLTFMYQIVVNAPYGQYGIAPGVCTT